MSIIQGTSKGSGAGYEIDQSIRFDSVRNSDLTRTLSGDGNLKTGTFSFWMKRSGLGSLQEIFTTYSIRSSFFFQSADTLSMQIYNGASYTTLTTTAVFRDPSAFAHYLFRWDTTQATDTDRLQFYYNGVLQTVTGTYPAQNSTTTFSDATYTHVISGDGSANTLYEIDGYLAEIHYVDGTALAATDFGEYNSDGVWIPIEASPTYGTNGFYITGETAGDLGEDFSGNNNDFTSAGLTTADQMLDTPTLNYCTLSPIDGYGGKLTLSDGNLRAVPSTSSYCNNHGTFYVGSGKWVYECKLTTVFGEGVGWSPLGERISGSSNRGWFMLNDGRAYINTTNQGTLGTSLSSGDYRYIFYDADNQAMWFAHCDVSSGTPTTLVYENGATKSEIETGDTTNAVFTSISAVDLAPGIWMDTGGVIETNFGQSAFYTTSDLPTGFNTLNTANLATPSITDGSAYFQPTLYTGNNGTQAIVNSGNSDLAPDWVWIKSRTTTRNHILTDAVRGVTKSLSSNNTSAEATDADNLTAFGSDGFTVGDATSYSPDVNASGVNYVAWQWKANGSGSSNTDGSITSTVSANTTSGFSICTYTGNGTSGATFGHGLGVAPKMVIVKERSPGGNNWMVGHDSLGWTKYIALDTTAAAVTSSTRWNNTAPSSTVVTLGNDGGINANTATYVAYCFAEIPGYSSFGSYTGNASADGTFIYTGFKPSFVLMKKYSGTGQWILYDDARDSDNVVNKRIYPNTSGVEDPHATNDHVDFLSNGFKQRSAGTYINSAGSYIYMAFAENPFGGDGVAPATAR